MTHRKPLLHPEQLLFTRELRKVATDAEQRLWQHLRARRLGGCKFRRQHPLPPYVLDFYCQELRLAVEVDGGQHFHGAGQLHYGERDRWLAGKGIRVLRFSSWEVLVETQAVLERILQVVGESEFPSPPAPLPEGEGSDRARPVPSRRPTAYTMLANDSDQSPLPPGEG